MGSKSGLILMMVGTLVCASVFAALAALPSPSPAVAQQQEATSLGEEGGESLADNIMSNVLDGGNDDGGIITTELPMTPPSSSTKTISQNRTRII